MFVINFHSYKLLIQPEVSTMPDYLKVWQISDNSFWSSSNILNVSHYDIFTIPQHSSNATIWKEVQYGRYKCCFLVPTSAYIFVKIKQNEPQMCRRLIRKQIDTKLLLSDNALVINTSWNSFRSRWSQGYTCTSFRPHRTGSIKLFNRCHIFLWLCTWGRYIISSYRLLHTDTRKTDFLFPWPLCSMPCVHVIGYVIDKGCIRLLPHTLPLSCRVLWGH